MPTLRTDARRGACIRHRSIFFVVGPPDPTERNDSKFPAKMA